MPNNVLTADNQQERSETVGWIVGFVDGEGCFSVSIHKNHIMSLGWQVIPEFVVTQGEKSLKALIKIQEFFKCGRIFVNNRYDNHKEPLYRYCVRSLKELEDTVIPFFVKNSLQTSKQGDFLKFKQVVELTKQRKHLTLEGLKEIAFITQTMNHKRPSKFLESSETIRRTPP